MTPWARRVIRDSVAGDREAKETERQGSGRVWWDRSKPEIERTIAIAREARRKARNELSGLLCTMQPQAAGPEAQGAVDSEVEQRDVDRVACQEPKRRPLPELETTTSHTW